ncbi:peptidylprolyl isomerase PpiC [Saccharospirillum alexandrii]|uniref:peptidylprolyl isomerase PpiC n=1 Tax=Saccharospirillum alexandrii TaxID=2448477 RepID=UPI0037363F7F
MKTRIKDALTTPARGKPRATHASALHILVRDEKKAQEVLGKLKQGADFDKLARQHSTCPSGKRGGDLGEFKRGAMVPAFDKAVFNGKPGELLGPVKTKFGYHVIKVLYLK